MKRTLRKILCICWIGSICVAASQAQSIVPPTPAGQPAATQPAAPPRSLAPEGVVFVSEWAFEQPLRFWSNGAQVESREGYYVGLVIDASRFMAQNAPDPQVFVGKTRAEVLFASPPATLDHKLHFVIACIPKLDLARERFWIGPRVLTEHLTAQFVGTAYAQTEKSGALAAPLAGETLRRALLRLSPNKPFANSDALLAAVERYRGDAKADHNVLPFATGQ